MARKSLKKPVEAPELEVTSFMNLMVVLIPFLLATAVFSQVSIQELNLPTPGSGGEIADSPVVTIEVVVRKSALELGNGKVMTHTFERTEEGEHDLGSLTAELLHLKEKNPDKEDITVLLEADVKYRDMIAVMDAVKIHKQVGSDESDESVVLFPDIAIGDAP